MVLGKSFLLTDMLYIITESFLYSVWYETHKYMKGWYILLPKACFSQCIIAHIYTYKRVALAFICSKANLATKEPEVIGKKVPLVINYEYSCAKSTRHLEVQYDIHAKDLFTTWHPRFGESGDHFKALLNLTHLPLVPYVCISELG